MSLSALSSRRQKLSTAVGLLAGGLAYGLTLLNWSTDVGRTALHGGIFSGVFDAQARALLAGHLWIDPDQLGIEGFRHDGRTYTYFPPFPALLRLPVLMTTREFDSRLTLLSMALAWIVLAVMATKLVWFLVARLSDTPEISRGTATLVACFLAAATGGTVLTFDAGSPWMYHEVYIWAVTGAVGSLYWLVRLMVDRDVRSATWLGWFTLVTIGTRATEGWAICLTVIATAAVLRLWRRDTDAPSLWWRVLLAGALPLAASIILNLAKFDAIYMFPLQTQVWTDISPQRRAALAANGGSLTGPQFFTTSFMAYLRPDGIRFTEYFPWISLPANPPPAYNGAFYDQAYRTGSATAFMPMLMLGFLVSAVLCLRPRASERLRALRAPLVASVLMTAGVMGYGYYSNRYASDFVPALVLGGAIATALLARWLRRRPRLIVPAVALTAVGALFSIAAQMSTGSFYAITLQRGEPLETYVSLQQRLSADPPRVVRTDGFPTGGRTDDLAVRGDCDALYLNIGDQYEPWITVVEREQLLELTPGKRLRSGRAILLQSDTIKRSVLELVVDAPHQQARFVLTRDGDPYAAPWFDVGASLTDSIRVGVRHATESGDYRLDSNVGQLAGALAARYLDEWVDAVPAELTVLPDESDLERLGFTARHETGPAPELCRRVADRAGLDLPTS